MVIFIEYLSVSNIISLQDSSLSVVFVRCCQAGGEGGRKALSVFAECLSLPSTLSDVVTLVHSCCGSAVAVLWGTELSQAQGRCDK